MTRRQRDIRRRNAARLAFVRMVTLGVIVALCYAAVTTSWYTRQQFERMAPSSRCLAGDYFQPCPPVRKL